MEETSAHRVALVGALLLGILADALLRPVPWGLGAALWTTGLSATALALRGRLPSAPANGPILAAAAFAAVFAWRDAPSLLFLCLVCALAAAALALLDRPARTGVVALAAAGLATIASAGLLMARLLPASWPTGSAGGVGWRRARTAAMGTLLALPLVAVFGVLFANADPLFARYASDLTRWFDDVIPHLTTIVLAAWVSGGLLAGLRWARCRTDLAPPRPERMPVGEVLVALGFLDLLFLSFLAVQARALVGGSAFVETTVGLSYAEYARQGFFQLAACAAIALPVLLAADWAVPRGTLRRRAATLLAGGLALMVAVVLGSAAHRMALYVEAYGLTELRLYTFAFMGWLAILWVLFGLTVLRGPRDRFAFGGLLAACALVAGLVILNPDATIVRTNAGRDRALDIRYALGLSTDAAPVLIEILPGLEPDARCLVAQRLLARWGGPGDQSRWGGLRRDGRAELAPSNGHSDWRTWSWSRWRARRAVDQARTELESAARSCPSPTLQSG